MDDLYVDAAGSAIAPYDTWAKAAATLQAAFTAASAGDSIWVIDTHSETLGANLTWSGSGTAASPVKVIAATGTGKVYSSTKPVFSGTAYVLNQGVSAEFYGFYFGALKSINLTWNGGQVSVFQDCTFQLHTATAERVQTRGSYSKAVVQDCEFYFGQTAQKVAAYAQTQLYVNNCSLHASSAAITNVFYCDTANGATFLSVEGGDYSGAATTANLFGDISTGNRPTLFVAEGVLLPSSGAITATVDQMGTRVEAYSCGTGTNIHSFEVQDMRGSAVDSTSVYVSASDAQYDKSSSRYSVEVTPTAASTYGAPFRVALHDGVWAAANQKFSVEVFYDAATSLTDANCWVEVEHPLVTTTVGRGRVSSRTADVSVAGTNLTTSSLLAGDWWGESGSNQNFQRIDVTVSGGAAGVHRAWFCLAPGATAPIVYVDPDVTVAAP